MFGLPVDDETPLTDNCLSDCYKTDQHSIFCETMIDNHMRDRAEIIRQSSKGEIKPEKAYEMLRDLLRKNICQNLE